MKVKYLLFLALTPLLFFASCSGGNDKAKHTSEEMRAPSLDFSADDSLAVVTLANNYLEAFGEKDYEAAADMLFKYENDSVRQLNADERKSYLNTMRQLPNYGCKLKGIALYNTNNNRLIYMMQVASSGSLDREEGIMKFYLNPVLKDGEWYLTLLDMNQEGTENLFNL